MSKYFRSPWSAQHYFIQNRLILAINDPAFNLVLPELGQSSWNSVLRSRPSDDDERERLEFVGDAIMHTSVALELYRQYPHGSPHFYTVRIRTFFLINGDRRLEILFQDCSFNS